MLPPFIPPSARAAGEDLPSITNFVIDRVEQSFGSSLAGSGIAIADDGGVATLPSIQDFVLQPVSHAADEGEFVQRTSRNPWGAYEASHEVAGGSPDIPVEPAHARLTPDMVLDHHVQAAGVPEPVVNEVAEPVETWSISAGSSTSEAADSSPDASGATPEVWMAEERDAFDWRGAANLTVPPAEAQRAAEEWSSTEWDRTSTSVQDHVATVLSQISRRVRSGELEVQGSRQMGNEAALVAALGALLAESSRK